MAKIPADGPNLMHRGARITMHMLKTTNPGLRDQEEFWNTWNATARDPTTLNQWTQRRGEVIIDLVHSLCLREPRILDFGCGTGWLSERLAEFGETTGIDLAERVIAAAKSRSPHIKFIAGDLFGVPLPRTYFDVVVSQEVIAHIPDQPKYFQLAYDVLKSGGFMIVTTPNKLVMDRSQWPPQPPEHIEQWLTMHRLKQVVRRRFRIVYTTTLVPMGNRGILRLVNSQKINAMLGLFLSQETLQRFKERAGLGYTLVVLAQKR